jgi:hypothetical protein
MQKLASKGEIMGKRISIDRWRPKRDYISREPSRYDSLRNEKNRGGWNDTNRQYKMLIENLSSGVDWKVRNLVLFD